MAADIVSKKKRSEMMSGISSKDTVPELTVRRLLHTAGFRFRLHQKALPGCPDLVMRKYNIVVFIHGCFWHRHRGCRYAYNPKTRKEFWDAKFRANVLRDHENMAKLKARGWRVLVIWECFTKHRSSKEMIKVLRGAILGQGSFYEYPTIQKY